MKIFTCAIASLVLATYGSPTTSPSSSPTFTPTTSPTQSPLIDNTFVCEKYEECLRGTLNYDTVNITGYLSAKEATIRANEINIDGFMGGYLSTLVPRSSLFVPGFRGAYGAKLDAAQVNEFPGFHAALSAEITTKQHDDVYLGFTGYFSAYSTDVTCSEGTRCDILCISCNELTIHVKPESVLKLKCDKPYSCQDVRVFHEGKRITLTGDGHGQVVVINDSSARRLRNKQVQPQVKEDHLMNSFEIIEQDVRKLQQSQTCFEPFECAGTSISSVYGYCYGSNSCASSKIRTTYAYCYGEAGCSDSTVRSNYVYAYGSHAAANSLFDDGNYVYAYGYRSLANTKVTSSNLRYIFANGYESFQNGYFKCNRGDSCFLSCLNEGCKGSILDCSETNESDNCQVTCDDKRANCPTVYERCSTFSKANGNMGKCENLQSEVCFKFDGECYHKNTDYCTMFETKETCLADKQSRLCSWDKGICVTKHLDGC